LYVIAERLVPSGALVIGAYDSLPEDRRGFEVWSESRGVYRQP
jgi:hypothetical protein